MNPRTISLVIAVAAVAAAGGYYLGRAPDRANPGAHDEAASHDVPAAAGSEDTAGAGGKPRRILYYRHPMGLKDTSPVPKKDSMGMDYIPVYEGEEPETAGAVTISPEKVQKLGVRTARAESRPIDRALRAVGAIEVAEPRQHTIAPKFDGWIERLHVSTTGAFVRRGQPLFEVYSPELLSAQQEYLIALRGEESLAPGSGASPEGASGAEGMRRLADAALARLRNWDVPASFIERLRRERIASRTVTFTAPIDGAVLEKMAVEGMRFMAGDTLYRLADLSVVWAIAEVSEQDLPWLRIGERARFETAALPGEVFTGRVDFLYPTVGARTRTARARIELPNAVGRLKPAMFGRVTLDAAGSDTPRLTVPASAVIDSGARQIVLVDRGAGRFEPREVGVGLRGAEYVEISSGLEEGEPVVVAANFLIDAESNLRGALAGMGEHQH